MCCLGCLDRPCRTTEKGKFAGGTAFLITKTHACRVRPLVNLQARPSRAVSPVLTPTQVGTSPAIYYYDVLAFPKLPTCTKLR